MNNIQIFKNTQFGEVRVATDGNNEPLFVANDIAKILGYAYPANAIQDHVDDDDKVIMQLSDIQDVDKTPNLKGSKITVVNESGVYSLILRSNLPQAKQFKRWVTSEVLPSIRKHGAYMTGDVLEQTLNNPDFLIQLATTLKQERAEKERLNTVIAEQAPKVLFAQAVETSQKSCLIGELAKVLKQNGIEIGQNRLFEWLRQNGYLCSKGEAYNQPTQKAMELELFGMKKFSQVNPDGSIRITTTTKVTGKGQIYFVDKFLNKQLSTVK